MPSAIKADAQNLVSTTRSAISSNNANLLATQTIETDSTTVNLYCGINSYGALGPGEAAGPRR